ncbi:asparagine and aspartate rich protein 2, putative [Plasmodium chabaudi adami]|uniref:Asparagine and aspartate rich protein 2, putative n=1 Tax=Plasmodium chabaudi adami TaxID=5826 RepID=A0A1D3LE74_PLACE|nr:asparagine and aspartate rich protein 2, putative [Plasmodium chabaudi adami]
MDEKRKHHKKKKVGKKAKNKKINKNVNKKYHKAFTFSGGINSAHRRKQHLYELEEKKLRIDKTIKEGYKNSPLIIAIHGPKGVGKSTLMKSIIKHYVGININEIDRPISIFTKNLKRYTFIEINDDILHMIDVAKIADICLLVIDGSFGFELETLEFTSILNTHGMPKVIGVVTHMDKFKDNKSIRKRKKKINKRFSEEMVEGSKIFFLSGIQNNRYNKTEIRNLCKFLSVMKRPLISWRDQHGYILGLKLDIEDEESYKDKNDFLKKQDTLMDDNDLRLEKFLDKCEDEVPVYVEGYVYGSKMYKNQTVHIPNIGDVKIENIKILQDPFKINQEKKTPSIYAPMSDVGNLSFDFDNMYIHIPNNKVNFTKPELLMEKPDQGEASDSTGGDDNDDDEPSDGTDDDVDGSDSEEESDSDESSSDIEKHDSERKAGENSKYVTDSIKMIRELQDCKYVFSKNTDEDDIKLFDVKENDMEGGIGQRRKAPSNVYISEKQKKKKMAENYVNEKSREYNKLQSILFEKKNKEEDYNYMSNINISDNDDDENDKGYNEFYKKYALQRDKEIENGQHEYDYSENEQMDLSNLNNDMNPYSNISNLLAFENKINIDVFLYNHNYINRINNCLYFKGDLINIINKEKRKITSSDVPDQDINMHIIKNTLCTDTLNIEENKQNSYSYMHSNNYFFNHIDSFNMTNDDVFIFNNLSIFIGDIVQEELVDNFFSKYEELYSSCFVKSEEEEDEEENEKGNEEYDENEEESGKASDMAKGGSTVRPIDENLKLLKEKKEKEKEKFLETEEIGVLSNMYGSSVNIGEYVKIEMIIKRSKLGVLKNNLIICGGLQSYEEKDSIIHCRVKKHRWFPKVMRSNDPLIFSVGWRRYQSIPIYSINERNNVRTRFLKYTTEHMHCNCTFYGPLSGVNSGILAIYNYKKIPFYRICINGIILETNNNINIMKKLKLIGEPYKIFKNTAFIKNMFNSDLEVCKFINCPVITPSGIKGLIKNKLNDKGDFRCTFSDQIKKSDLVILKLYVNVSIKKYYNYDIENRLKSINELRYIYNIYVNHSSGYRKMPFRHFYHSKIYVKPQLLKQLPFKSKPKLFKKVDHENDTKNEAQKNNAINFKALENPKLAAKWYQMLHSIKKNIISKRKEKAKLSYHKKLKAKLKVQEEKDKVVKQRKKASYLKNRKSK